MIQSSAFLLLLIRQSFQILSECHCYNVQDNTICEKSAACQWQNNSCDVNQNYHQQSLSECSSYQLDDCIQQTSCAYINNQCTQFTSCDILSDCKLSKNCIYDGKKCLSKNTCVNYQTQIACSNQAFNDAYCLWSVSQNPKCQEIKNCSLLPQLKSHQLCNQALNICTVNVQGYCEEKLNDCTDYAIQQCFETLNGKECFWDQESMACLERKCENAKYSTDNECKIFNLDCTTNGINCVQRFDCQSIAHQNGCIVDNQNNECYWTGLMCLQKTCTSIQSGQNCYTFFPDLSCIPTALGSCKDMPNNCLGFETQISCNEDILNLECFWISGSCVQKTCSNAPQFSDCALWKKNSSCVGDSSNYCVELPTYCSQVTNMAFCYKQLSGQQCQFYSCSIAYCSKAPGYYNSHSQCEQWNIDCTVDLQLGGCIYKSESCSNYNNLEQCHSTLNKVECIYMNSICQQKTCEMGLFSTNSDCQNWNKNCITNEFATQCIKWPSTCFELINQQQCYLGLQNGTYCEWTGTYCMNQSNSSLCASAQNNSIFDDHEKCNRWNGNCTVLQKVYGCQARQICENYLYSHQCVVAINNQQCYWNGTACFNKCSQQQTETVLFSTCLSLDSSCTLNNLKATCIFKTYCSSYFNELDCIINHSNQPCIWDSYNQKCQDVTCESNTTATHEYQCTYYLNYQQCQLDGVGCITRPKQCSDISNQLLCNKTIPRCKNKFCYYANGCCNEILANQCELITDAVSNEECQKYNSECILNLVTSLGCMNYKSCEQIQNQTLCTSISGALTLPNDQQCSSYNGKCHSVYSCEGHHTSCNTFAISSVNCKTSTSGICTQKLCSDFTGTASIANCHTFQSFCYFNSSLCKTATSCSDFTSSGSTICSSSKTIYGSYCQWVGSVCQISQCSTISNSYCVMLNNQCMQGPSSNCIDIISCNQITNESYCYLSYNTSNLKCLWINSTCLDYQDCTNAYAINFTEYECTRYDLCKLNQVSIGCQYKDCEDYTQMEYCNLLTQCTWDSDKCNNNYECKFQLNQTNCESLSFCYWNGSLCNEKVCSTATTKTLCDAVILKSGIKCLWKNSSCIEYYQCSDIKDPLYFEDCNNQNYNCVIKFVYSDKTNFCQPKKISCNLYITHHACTFDIYNNKCQWDTSTQQCINVQCQTYSNATYSNIICQQFNNDCVINLTSNGCRFRLSACASYLNLSQCMYAKTTSNNYCYWNGASCVNAQCSQYASLTTPPMLCTEYASCSLVSSVCVNRFATCNLYVTESECNLSLNSSGQQCGWISNSCQLKTCTNNPNQIFNHTKCQEWLSTCTVNDQLSQCIPIVDCTTAPTEIDSISQCESFITTSDICTISTKLGGCANLPLNCSVASRTQCFIDQNRNKCYWSIQTATCKDFICSNIDTTVITALDCEAILDSCTISSTGIGCQNKSQCINYPNSNCQMANIRDQNNRNCIQGCQLTACEDYIYQTDTLCKSILDGSCITNGIQCITHNTCNDFKFQSQCNISKQGDICYWLEDQDICVIKKCSLADSTYSNAYLCQQFMNVCTYSQIQEACVDIGQCNQLDNQDACNLQQCIWYQNQCYDPNCNNTCGDGIVDINTEQCDDGNMIPNDGCYQCQYSCVKGCMICDAGICVLCDFELGYYLNQQDKCVSQCGDQIIQGNEQCDDGNNLQYDGCYQCNYQCHYACLNCFKGKCLECKPGWSISLQDQCEVICGDGYAVNFASPVIQDYKIEQCDDKNLDNFDGCSDQCLIEDHWACFINQDGESVCQYVDYTLMMLSLVTPKPNIQQKVLLSFSQKLKKSKDSKQQLMKFQILNVDPQYYNIVVDALQYPSQMQFLDISFMITINFYKSLELPLLQVNLDSSQLIDENNLNPSQTIQRIRLYTCYYETKQDLQISQTTTTFNSILLYFLLAIAIIAILTMNLEILWNLLDMVQYLSYVKYINIQFPSNLNSFFALFDIITLQPAIQFLRIQDFVNLLSYGEEVFIATTNKFKQDNLNAFYFYNFTSSMLIFGVSFVLYFFSSVSIQFIFQQHLKFYNHFYFNKLASPIVRTLLKFILYFFYSGIVRTFLTNTYDLLFTVLLQLYYPEFDTFLKIVSVAIAIGSLSMILIGIYLILAKQNNMSMSFNDQFKVLSEDTGSSTSQWVRQFSSLLLVKKVVFMLLLIFMQRSGELQTTFISIAHISFSLYLIQKQPIKNKYEYYKNLIVETQVSIATCLFLAYTVPTVSLEQKYNLGWLHITIFTSILACSVFFDLTQQIKLLVQKVSKVCNQKPQLHSIVLFETLPIQRQEFLFAK